MFFRSVYSKCNSLKCTNIHLSVQISISLLFSNPYLCLKESNSGIFLYENTHYPSCFACTRHLFCTEYAGTGSTSRTYLPVGDRYRLYPYMGILLFQRTKFRKVEINRSPFLLGIARIWRIHLWTLLYHQRSKTQ